MTYNWIKWTDVSIASKDFDSDDVKQKSDIIISEACQIVYDELSGVYNMSRMISNGIPDQVKRLAIYKAREFASIIYWGNATSGENNTAAAYWLNQYQLLLTSIKDGKVQVEGYERLHSFTKPTFY